MLKKQLRDAYSEISGDFIETTDTLEIAKELVVATRAKVRDDFLTIVNSAFDKAPTYNDKWEDEKTRVEIIKGFEVILGYFDTEAVKVTENYVIFDNVLDDVPLDKMDILVVEDVIVDQLVHRSY